MSLPFLHAPKVDLLDQQHSPDLQRIRIHVRRLQQPEQHDAALATLERLANAYRFRHFSRQCDDGEQPVFDHLICPEQRRQAIGVLPADIMQYLSAYEKLLENRMQWSDLAPNRQQQKTALALANRHALFNRHNVFSDFDHLCRELDIHQRMALLCTAELQQHCLGSQTEGLQQELFHSGVESATIALEMAGNTQHSPLSVYLCSLLHHIALLYLHRALTLAVALPDENRLLDRIQQLNHRLAYWIAKDWGFPDRLLEHLKLRFNTTSGTNTANELLDKSEHAALLLALQYRGLLSKRQTRKLLQIMQLPEIVEMASSDPTMH